MADDFERMVRRQAGRARPRPQKPPEATFSPFTREGFTGTPEDYTRLLWAWMKAPAPIGDDPDPPAAA